MFLLFKCRRQCLCITMLQWLFEAIFFIIYYNWTFSMKILIIGARALVVINWIETGSFSFVCSQLVLSRSSSFGSSDVVQHWSTSVCSYIIRRRFSRLVLTEWNNISYAHQFFSNICLFSVSVCCLEWWYKATVLPLKTTHKLTFFCYYWPNIITVKFCCWEL